MTCKACVPALPNRAETLWAPCFRTRIRLRRLFWLLPLAFLLLASPAYPQANGKLQLHFMDVGQGDGAVLISPGGEVVLFDDGKYKFCDKPTSYLHHLGIDHTDYLIVSHYHADHIGCTKEVLATFLFERQPMTAGEATPRASSRTTPRRWEACATRRPKAR